MLDFGGKTLLQRQLEAYNKNNIKSYYNVIVFQAFRKKYFCIFFYKKMRLFK